MHFRGLDMNLLVALDALLRERSVTRAAESLFISQPSLSAALQKLRWHFSDELLIRVSARRLDLTPRARELVEPVREILLRTSDLLNSEAKFHPLIARRVFRLSMSNLCSELVTPLLMKKLLEEAPRITCQIVDVSPNALAQLNDGETDLCLSIVQRRLIDPNINDDEITDQNLFTDRLVVIYARKKHKLNTKISYEEFCNLPYIEVRFAGSVVSLVESTFRRQKIKPSTRLIVSNYAQAASVVSGSSMVAVIPERFARIHASSLELGMIECPIKMPILEEMMMWNKRSNEDAGHIWLREKLVEVCSSISLIADKN